MKIAYERTGEGPPLVLLHPLGVDRHIWAPIVHRLRDRRELVTVDLPGFGESPPLLQTPTPRALAQAVAELLASIEIIRPHVAGNSLGGWVTLELGLSGVARTATAIAPAGLWPQPLVPKSGFTHTLANRLLPLVGPVARSAPGRRLLLSGTVAHPGRVPGKDAAHLVRAYAQAPGFIAVNNAMRAGRFEGLERIRCPLTLIWPEHDRLINRPPWLPDNVDNVALEDAGHVPIWDAPDELAEILLAAGGGDRAGPAAQARSGATA
jgi:pimeloyl-ACP methyl ester carboxylesterase